MESSIIYYPSSKKKGFSFLEMLIVVMIVGIFFVVFKSAFEVKNKETLYAQACIESIYGQVNNFVYAALSSKGIFDGSGQIYPDQYMINFIPLQQTIELAYIADQSDISTVYSSISITGSANAAYCANNSYKLSMTGDAYRIIIHKGLTQDTSLKSFFLETLTGQSIPSTGENIFLSCDNQGVVCKTIARFQADIRTLTLQKQICLFVSDTGTCTERDN